MKSDGRIGLMTALLTAHFDAIFAGIVALVGALVGGSASVVTVLLTNRKAAQMKKDDYRREELDRMSDAIATAQKTITRIYTITELLREIGQRSLEGEDTSDLKSRVPAQREAVNQDSIDAEAALTRIVYLIPHESIRELATETLSQIAQARTRVRFLTSDVRSDELYRQAVEKVSDARDQCTQLREQAIAIYHLKRK